MNDLYLTPASDCTVPRLCDALNAGYEGYLIPVNFTPEALLRRIAAEHVDLAQSALLEDAEARTVGAMLIARRGTVSRVAALGIARPFRGRGLGAAAIAQAVAAARERSDRRLVLEVIEGNTAAIATYRRAGFQEVRRLVGYTRGGTASGPVGRVACTPAEALQILDPAYPLDASWQTAPACFAGACPPIQAFTNPEGTAAALVDASGEVVRLLAFGVAPWAWRKEVGSRFMEALLAAYPERTWKIAETLPEGQAAGFLARTGWKRTELQQIEMVHHLG